MISRYGSRSKRLDYLRWKSSSQTDKLTNDDVNILCEYIDKIIYINLDKRTDRRVQLENELKLFPAEKVQRFSAVEDRSLGGLGCTKSHIAVLELAKENNWNTILILEDDMVWNKTNNSISDLVKLLNNPYDVILLGCTEAFYNTSTFRVYSALTSVGYVINSSYYDTLINNFKQSHDLLYQTRCYPVFALDQYWRRLQSDDNWYLLKPSLCIQKPGYSDIVNKFIKYEYN